MFNFNEEAVRKEHENGVGIIAKTQEVVDQICKEGFKNIFYIGIGGTILYAGQMEHIVKEAGSTIPLILENAADFNWVGNPHFGKDSIVAIASISGDTKEVVEAALDFEKCPYEAEVSLVLTTDEEIRKTNAEFRKIDRVTDVLSFPMLDFDTPGDFSFLEEEEDAFHPDTGELILGDIMIAVGRMREQEVREYAFLIAHSMLHLMGYDHMEPNEAAVMEKKQEEILEELGILRK